MAGNNFVQLCHTELFVLLQAVFRESVPMGHSAHTGPFVKARLRWPG